MARFDGREGERARQFSWLTLVVGGVSAAATLILAAAAATTAFPTNVMFWVGTLPFLAPLSGVVGASLALLWVARGRSWAVLLALPSAVLAGVVPVILLVALVGELPLGDMGAPTEDPPPSPEVPREASFALIAYDASGEAHHGGTGFLLDVDGRAVLVTAFSLFGDAHSWDPVLSPEAVRSRVMGVRSSGEPIVVAGGGSWLPLADVTPPEALVDVSRWGDVIAFVADDAGRSRFPVADHPPRVDDWVWIVVPYGDPVAAKVFSVKINGFSYHIPGGGYSPATGAPVVDGTGAVLGVHQAADGEIASANPVGRFVPELALQAGRAARRAGDAPPPVDDALLCELEVRSACRRQALADDALDADGLRAALTAQCDEQHFAPSCQDLVWLDAGRPLPRPEADHPAACRTGDALSCMVHLESSDYGDDAPLRVAAEGCAVGVGDACAWLDARVHAVEHYAAVGDDARIALAAACRSTNPAPCGALAALFVANGDRDGALRVARYACDADLAWACVRLGYVLDPELGGGDTGW